MTNAIVEALNAAAPAINGARWKDPAPLPPALPEAPEMVPDLLPPALRAWLCDIAERTQAPLDYAAIPALVALSSVVGRSRGIHPKVKDDWLVIPNLWGAVIGRPGRLKSPVMNEALRPLRRLERLAGDAHRDAEMDAEITRATIDARIEAAKTNLRAAAKKGDDVTGIEADYRQALQDRDAIACHERRYATSDTTVEKLGELLNQNPRGLLAHRDELVGFFKTLEKPGHESDRAFYLEAWAGDGEFTYDRIGRGTLHIPALTVSLVGGMTPGRLTKYIGGALDGGHEDDGLMQRLQLAVWPELSTDWRNVDRYPDTAARDEAFAIFEAMANSGGDGVAEITALRFSGDGQEAFTAWHEDLETWLRTQGEDAPAFESHMAKYRSLMPSLALLFQLAESPDAQCVDLPSVRRAMQMTEFLERHARKIYAAEISPDLTAAHRLAGKIRQGAITAGMHLRDVYRPQWAGLSDAETIANGMRLLAKHNIARIAQQETGGRPADIIDINPKAR